MAKTFNIPKSANCLTCDDKRRSVEPGEPEVDAEFNEGIVTFHVRLPLECTDCGSEAKTIIFDVESPIPESAEVEEC